MTTLPLKSSRNEQCAVIRFFLWAKGLKANDIHSLPHPPYSPDLAPSDYHLFGSMKKMLGGQKFASDTDRGAISCSSVAWTAASIVLCIGHSEAC